MKDKYKTASDLKVGEKGIIKEIEGFEYTNKLLEMGCLPGTKLLLKYTAPFGDPLCLALENGCLLSLRKKEAASIILE